MMIDIDSFARLAAAGCAAASVLSVLYPSVKALSRKTESTSITLTLRKLHKSGAEMLGGGTVGSNVFADEYNDLFLAITEVLDFAVMRYVKDCPILIEQEYGHAKMHHQGIKEAKTHDDHLKRFGPLKVLFRLLFLRLGPAVGSTLSCAIETLSSRTFHSMAVFPYACKGSETDLVLYHYFEEMEHGALTVQSLKRKSSIFLRLALFPVMCLLTLVFFVIGPIVTKLASDPLLFIRRPLAIFHLPPFLLKFGYGNLVSWYEIIAVWISPWAKEDMPQYKIQNAQVLELLKAREVGFDIVKTEDYSYEY